MLTGMLGVRSPVSRRELVRELGKNTPVGIGCQCQAAKEASMQAVEYGVGCDLARCSEVVVPHRLRRSEPRSAE